MKLKFLNLYMKNWYYAGGILFVVLAFIIGFFGDGISPLQKIYTLSFMALLVHQFEEYALPGGFPAIMNMVMSKDSEIPDKYPLNQKNAFIVNIILAYPFYISVIFHPNLIWLGIAQIIFGMMQFFVHGIFVNVKMKSIYNPGLGAVVFLHWPIGIYYIWYIYAKGIVQSSDWIWGIITLFVAALLLVALPVRLLRNKNSEHPFSKEEMKRFNVPAKLERLKK